MRPLNSSFTTEGLGMSAPMMRMAMRSRPDAVSSAAPLATAASASAASVPSRSKLGRVSGCKSESFSAWSAQAMSSAGPVAPMHSRMVLYAQMRSSWPIIDRWIAYSIRFCAASRTSVITAMPRKPPCQKLRSGGQSPRPSSTCSASARAYIEGCSEPSLATTFCRYMAELAPDSRVRTRN